MPDYPLFDVVSTDYAEPPRAGSETVFAADGTPWVVRRFSTPYKRFQITHWNMTLDEQAALLAFFEATKSGEVRFLHPRYGNWWVVMIEDEPQVTGMPTPKTVDMRVMMVGKPE